MAKSERETSSVWRAPGMPPLLGLAALCFSGFSLLISVAPLWAVHGGTDDLGAGVVNGVLMACTVVSQLLVGWTLRRLGWGATLALGACLLGLPGLGHLLSDDVRVVVALAAVRGLGFGILTVCGSTAVASLIGPGRRGRAVGVYGLAIAVPQVLFLPAAPWLAENVGFPLVFALATAPVLAIPLAPLLARALPTDDRPRDDRPRDDRPEDDRTADDRPEEDRAAEVSGAAGRFGGVAPVRLGRILVGPVLALLVITAAGGSLMTFAPRLLDDPTVVLLALLGFTATAALCRWRFGAVADRVGPAPAIAPLLLVGTLGLVGVGTGAARDSGTLGPTLIVIGMLVVGVAYGGLQNLTLVYAFDSAGEQARGPVSVVWNIGFDSGTGLGALAAGAVATSVSYPASYAVLATSTALVGAAWAGARWTGRRRTA